MPTFTPLPVTASLFADYAPSPILVEGEDVEIQSSLFAGVGIDPTMGYDLNAAVVSAEAAVAATAAQQAQLAITLAQASTTGTAATVAAATAIGSSTAAAASATAAAASATAAATSAAKLPPTLGNGLAFPRVNSAATTFEYRTPDQIISDISAVSQYNPVFYGDVASDISVTCRNLTLTTNNDGQGGGNAGIEGNLSTIGDISAGGSMFCGGSPVVVDSGRGIVAGASQSNHVSIGIINYANQGVRVYGASADIPLSLVPKGSGALVAADMDYGSGGDLRGAWAVDLQLSRGSHSQVAGGSYATILGGMSNTASGGWALAGQNSCQAAGNCSVALGSSSNDRGRSGSFVYASSPVVSGGDGQMSFQILHAVSSAVASVRLTSDGAAAGPANIVNLTPNSAMVIDVSLVGRDQTTGDCAVWTCSNALVRMRADYTSLAVVGTPVFVAGVTTGAGSVALSALPTFTATSATGGGINISLTPKTASNSHWVARVRVVEVA